MGPAGPRVRFRLWLYRAYAEGVERVEPEPRTLGDVQGRRQPGCSAQPGPLPSGKS